MIGKCSQCGSLLGRRSANGKFVINRNKFKQVALIYKNIDESLQQHTTRVPIPLCAACFDNVQVGEIEKILSPTEGVFKQLRNLNAVYTNYEIELE